MNIEEVRLMILEFLRARDSHENSLILRTTLTGNIVNSNITISDVENAMLELIKEGVFVLETSGIDLILTKYGFDVIQNL
ncbi:hypothetical protein MKU65_02350 [Leptospira interrogans]|nr:hypothetical protein [Leptospira interrogans]ALN99217.1 hypothetical protein LIH_02455 [Leptospira interrogans serovar Hardjo-prajitno]MCH1885168.1 hypothetical protein [Leptospira interrogans]MCH1891414.1 hypothetical protein [Leptospira interrogans]MCH1898208.1 hypothetical protein [Leptospira interrogans]MCH1901591.1 hypothetical protein [Leptospira interrogans]